MVDHDDKQYGCHDFNQDGCHEVNEAGYLANNQEMASMKSAKMAAIMTTNNMGAMLKTEMAAVMTRWWHVNLIFSVLVYFEFISMVLCSSRLLFLCEFSSMQLVCSDRRHSLVLRWWHTNCFNVFSSLTSVDGAFVSIYFTRISIQCFCVLSLRRWFGKWCN